MNDENKKKMKKKRKQQTTRTKSFEFVVFHYFNFDLRSLLNAFAQIRIRIHIVHVDDRLNAPNCMNFADLF